MAAIEKKNKPLGPENGSGEILNLGGEAMVPSLARLLDIQIRNAAIPSDWKRATVVPIYKGGDGSLVTNYRSVSLTSVVCGQIEHIASYSEQVWDRNDWLYESQHGFRSGYSYSCESKEHSVCQNTTDLLDNGARFDAYYNRFFEGF